MARVGGGGGGGSVLSSTASCSRPGRKIVNRRFLIEDSAVDKLGEGRAPPGIKCPRHHNDMTTRINTIPDRPLTGLPRSAPSTTRDGGGKYATGTRQDDNIPSKIRGRSNITIGTWNVRTLHAVGKMEEREHEMEHTRFK